MKDTGGAGVQPYVLIIHEVDAYDVWKQVFDQAAPMRKAAGEISYQLLREQSSDHNLVHLSRWTSLDAARGFFESVGRAAKSSRSAAADVSVLGVCGVRGAVLGQPSGAFAGRWRRN